MASNTNISIKCSICDASDLAGNVKKRLIVCCDGTDNASDKGIESNATNIGRLSRVFANCGFNKEGEKVAQVVHYASGVATGSMSWASNKIQAGFGVGFDAKVCEAYNFLTNNYGKGDEIFLFGFSRGAYTVRALASLICEIGLLAPGMMDYFDEVFTEYKNRDLKKPFSQCDWAQRSAEAFKGEKKLGLSQEVLDQLIRDTGKRNPTNFDYLQRWAHVHAEIEVVGVFDTVGSISMTGWAEQPGTDLTAYSTRLHPKIKHAFQALALDETRGNFAPTLWYKDHSTKGVDLRQCWFPGYHSDVGGHSDAPSDTNSIDEITFAWMVDQLDGLVQFSSHAFQYPIISRLVKDKPENKELKVTPAPKTPEEVMARRIKWSDGELIETNSWFFYLASATSTLGRHSQYVREPGVYYAEDDIHTHIKYQDFCETIHPCVAHRQREMGYLPVSFKQDHVGSRPYRKRKEWNRVKMADGQGWEWVRTVEGEPEPTRLHEYVIPVLDKKPAASDNKLQHWSGSLEREILNACDPAYLAELDKQNTSHLRAGYSSLTR